MCYITYCYPDEIFAIRLFRVTIRVSGYSSLAVRVGLSDIHGLDHSGQLRHEASDSVTRIRAGYPETNKRLTIPVTRERVNPSGRVNVSSSRRTLDRQPSHYDTSQTHD